MKVKITWPTGAHKKGDTVEVDAKEGSALVCQGCAEVVEYDKPKRGAAAAALEKPEEPKKGK